jgi:hypothetical protein
VMAMAMATFDERKKKYKKMYDKVGGGDINIQWDRRDEKTYNFSQCSLQELHC